MTGLLLQISIEFRNEWLSDNVERERHRLQGHQTSKQGNVSHVLHYIDERPEYRHGFSLPPKFPPKCYQKMNHIQFSPPTALPADPK